MPSGKTHDAITIILAVPAFAGSFMATKNLMMAASLAATFLFGGLMFGPDLDTVSRQYSRWSIFRFIWVPYRRFFKHRSRFTHGLVFGAFCRVVYFMGVLTLAAFAGAYLYTAYYGGRLPGFLEFSQNWQTFGGLFRATLGDHFFLIVFIGLWAGAASHTFTDMAGTFIKSGRREKLF